MSVDQPDRRRFAQSLAAVACASTLSVRSTLATAMPLEQVRVVYGFPAGSAGDSVARTVAKQLSGSGYSQRSGVVENRPGATSHVALESLHMATPDGAVLCLAPLSCMAIYPHMASPRTYAPEDFAPLTTGAWMHHALAVGPLVPASVRSLKDFGLWAKHQAGSASYGTPGHGSLPHLLGALLARQSKLPLSHTPYRGTAPALADLVTGRIAAVLSPSGDFLPYARAGQLRVLATSGTTRNPHWPHVPTFAELGFDELTAEEWLGFYAHAHTPNAVRLRAHAALVQALDAPGVQQRIRALGLRPQSSSPEAMLQSQHAAFARWGHVVHQLGFTVDL